MTATSRPAQSPAPGISPERAPIPANAHTPTAAAFRAVPRPKRRSPVNAAVAKVMSALRGDKYMVDAYPAAGPEDGTTSDSAASVARKR
jgi:hypothetical protein